MVNLKLNKKIGTGILAAAMALCALAPCTSLTADAAVSSGWQHTAVNTTYSVNLYESDTSGNSVRLGKMYLNADGTRAQTTFHPATKTTYTVYVGTSTTNYTSRAYVQTTTAYGIKMTCTGTGYGKVNAHAVN